MEPVTITLAVIALLASSISLFFKRLKKCKTSGCCEVEMRRGTIASTHDTSFEDAIERVREISDSIPHNETEI